MPADPPAGPRRGMSRKYLPWFGLMAVRVGSGAVAALTGHAGPRTIPFDQPGRLGYVRVGAVAGTTFWAKGGSPGSIFVRGVHGPGGGCDYGGPDVSAAGQSRVSAALPGAGEGEPLCRIGGLRGTDFAAWLLPASAPPVTVTLSDGSTATQTAAVDVSRVASGESIRVVYVPGGDVTIVSH